MAKVIFKHPEQAKIYQPLLDAVNKACEHYGKDVECVAGWRSLETQKATNALVLATREGAYQTKDGAVYTGKGKDKKCWASAYGESKHCFCICLDVNGWMELLTNDQLKPYGLVKPIPHEPWHITLIELVGISQEHKESIRDSVLNGVDEDMNIKEFQAMTGLFEDGVAGPITKAKAKEVLAACHEILGIPDFKTAEEVVSAWTSNPTLWKGNLKTVRYLGSLIMTIVNKMKGE